MRIAYVILHLDELTMQGGVGKKIQRQVNLWREMTHHVRVFILSPDEYCFDGVKSYSFDSSTSKLSKIPFLHREFSRSRVLQKIIRDVETYHPDIVYLRYGLYTVPLHKLFKKLPGVVEINTNDIDEYLYRGWFYYWVNKLTRGIIFGHAAGIVAPTFELQEMPCNQMYGKPITVVSNGIDLDDFIALPPTNNKTPVLAFVATPGYPWHGFDKIHKLADMCQDIKFLIIGYGLGDSPLSPPSNMELLGFLNKEEIRKALMKVDAVFGTLALHRKNMEEASPLKVREALAYGLPVIYAYKDTDLADLESEYLLRLPNTEYNVIDNVDRIRKFAYQMRGQRVKSQLILSRIDQRKKEKQRLAFFETILRSL
jgi:glycosyltransferase involved in cell wall biosynthesis